VSDDLELEQLLGPLRDGPVALSGTDSGRVQRDRLLPLLRAQVGRVPQARRRARVHRQIGAGVLAGGALFALAIGVQLLRPGAGTPPANDALRVAAGSPALTWIDADGESRTANASAQLVGPGELRGADTRWSQLSTARGVQITLSPRARLRAVGAAAARAHARPELELLAGEVHCRVPHLGTRDQFSIATPDAQVIVHGTVFSVRFDPSAQPATCVRVEQGLVEVRQNGASVRLGPGAELGCTPPAAERTARAKASQSARPAQAAQPSASATQTAPRRAQPPQHEAGTLDEENRLLSAALAAEREGDRARARALFGELLRRHPASPLAPEARRGLTRTR
jgi:hypothetical protein